MLSNEILGKEATLYTRLPTGRLRCTACARFCEIPEGKVGLCGIRGVLDNKLRLFVYGRVIAGHIDPIEKKPVPQFFPLPRLGVIGFANTARITIFRSDVR